jgi:hypothetical protein
VANSTLRVIARQVLAATCGTPHARGVGMRRTSTCAQHRHTEIPEPLGQQPVDGNVSRVTA